MTTTNRRTRDLIEIEEFFTDPTFAAPPLSADGTRLAYSAPAGGRLNLWVRGVEQTHEQAVQVTDDTRRGIHRHHWTDDPRWLLYQQDTDGNEDWHLYRVDLDDPSGPAVDLTPMAPGSRVMGVEPVTSVPGTVLVWMNRRTLSVDVFRIDVAAGETTVHLEQDDPRVSVLLDRHDEPASQTVVTPQGTVEVSGFHAGTPHPVRTLGGAEHPMGIHPQLVTADGQGLLVGSFGDGDHLRLVRIDRMSGEETVVAEVDGLDLDISGTAVPGVLPPMVYTARRTGDVLAARFVADRPLPLVLAVHGGPWMHDGWGYSPEVQFLANRGYAVLQVNFRGSLGYGRHHVTAAIGEFARAMHDDLIDAVDWAIAEGYAALVGVTVTPDRFAAAVDYVGVSDLANFLRTLPEFVRPHFVNNWYRYVGDPGIPEQESDMRSRSPITMVERIRTPLLVAQGANDVRVVQAESDNIVASLRERDVPVEYLLAQDEGHGFANPENRRWLYRAIEGHFATHIGGRALPTGHDEEEPR